MHTIVATTAQPTIDVIRGIRPDQLGAATPCSEYDVRALVNHLLFWGPSLVGAARKESVPPPAPSEQDADLTAGDWAKSLEAHLDELVTAWSTPDAWEGVTQMGGPMKLPAPMIGGMTLGELVVHGWDLGRATGQSPRWDDDVLRAIHDGAAATAEQGRQMGIYGPEVPVPADAPWLDRLLGLTGRDPAWKP
ncbi:TIGR03086 family metal-binding protein [Cryptosporangium aurantiacum]|uniref:TIGR03086 family protein n=1 Tax=Cryptosporangium aurantiacum TaxID=134849 RepID=A0A1M7M7A5_9ACTN|nr:TIGR03086 family metal-binding protein [Cryptosporangium aurantiacum]SHM86626.1 TIGR03086 family protein [Cryptosporangium aurantiacum]